MKLKDIIMNQDELEPKICRNYDDFIEPAAKPEKTSLLKFIDFCIAQDEYCPEKTSTKEFADNTDKKRNSEKKVPYSQLSLKQRIRRLKNMKHYPIDSGYYTKYGNSFSDYL